MAGHSHWKQVKRQKGSADARRSAFFSKSLRAISIAAREEKNPDFNPRLRSAVQKARKGNVPQDNIERAIKKASEKTAVEEIIMETYGPGGIAMLITGFTDNANRTVQEAKAIIKEFEGKRAEPGSVRWAFESKIDEPGAWQVKFPQTTNAGTSAKLSRLVSTLEDREDINKVFLNNL